MAPSPSEKVWRAQITTAISAAKCHMPYFWLFRANLHQISNPIFLIKTLHWMSQMAAFTIWIIMASSDNDWKICGWMPNGTFAALHGNSSPKVCQNWNFGKLVMRHAGCRIEWNSTVSCALMMSRIWGPTTSQTLFSGIPKTPRSNFMGRCGNRPTGLENGLMRASVR